MYVDVDNNGRYLLADLTATEFETIRRALISHRTGMINTISKGDDTKISDCEEQYLKAGEMLTKIENL